MTTSKTKVAHPKHEIGLFGVRLCFVSVMEHIIDIFPFNVKLLRRRIAFAVTEGREGRGDTETFKNTPCLPTSVCSVFCAAGNGAG